MSDKRYKVYAYVEHEDCQYGRKVELSKINYSSLRSAVESAKHHFHYGKYYQTMVYDGNQNMIAACRYGENLNIEVYRFIKGTESNAISKDAEMLTATLINEGNNFYEYVLYEQNGNVNIRFSNNSSEKYMNIFSSKFSWVSEYAMKLIMTVNNYLDNPVKSIHINKAYRGDSLYVVASKEEKGSVDLHIDYF